MCQIFLILAQFWLNFAKNTYFYQNFDQIVMFGYHGNMRKIDRLNLFHLSCVDSTQSYLHFDTKQPYFYSFLLDTSSIFSWLGGFEG